MPRVEERLPALVAEPVRLRLQATSPGPPRPGTQEPWPAPDRHRRPDGIRCGRDSSAAWRGRAGISRGLRPSAAFIGKQLELLTDAVPGVTRVIVLLHPTHPMASPIVSELARAAQALGVQLHLLEVHDPTELDTVLVAMTHTRAEALLVPPFPLFDVQRHRILAVAAQRRLPVIATDVRRWVEEGALLFYGMSSTANHRRAAAYVDRF